MPKQEVQFLLACLRSRHDPRQRNRLVQLAGQSLDWDYIARIAYAHGLLPYLHLLLSPIADNVLPERFSRVLAEHHRANALRNRMLDEEFRRIQSAFTQAGVQAVPFKGIVFAACIYEDPAARQFGDLDFLVPEADIDRARQVLEEHGLQAIFRWMGPSGSKAELGAGQEDVYRSVYHEYEYQSRDGLINIDLHWRLLPRVYPTAIPDAVVWRNLVTLSLDNDLHFDSFSNELTLVYLCIHAAKDGWSELKWALDISELVCRPGQLDWDRIHAFATQFHCRKMLRAGLLMAQWLTGVAIPAGAIDPAMTSRSLQRTLTRLQGRLMSRPGRKHARMPCFGINRTYLRLCDRISDQLVYVFRRLTFTQARDYDMLGLTDRLLPVWPWLRPLRILCHCGRKALTRKPESAGA